MDKIYYNWVKIFSLWGLPTKKNTSYFLEVAVFVGEWDSFSLVTWGNWGLGMGWRGYLWKDEVYGPKSGLFY